MPGYYRFLLRFAKIREGTQRKLAAFAPGLTEYIIARTAFFDGLFVEALKDRLPQIVLLGAGYDSRAYRFAEFNRGTKIFEMDAAPTQERKKQRLRAARVPIPSEVRFAPVHFGSEPLAGVLEKAGFLNEEATLFFWEGVSYYLSQEQVVEILALAGRCAANGSAIAFDYTIPVTEENQGRFYGAAEFLKFMRENHANEALLFSIPEGQTGAYLASQGLSLIEDLGYEAIEKRFLTDENGTVLGRMTGNFRIILAAPREQVGQAPSGFLAQDR